MVFHVINKFEDEPKILKIRPIIQKHNNIINTTNKKYYVISYYKFNRHLN